MCFVFLANLLLCFEFSTYTPPLKLVKLCSQISPRIRLKVAQTFTLIMIRSIYCLVANVTKFSRTFYTFKEVLLILFLINSFTMRTHSTEFKINVIISITKMLSLDFLSQIFGLKMWAIIITLWFFFVVLHALCIM